MPTFVQGVMGKSASNSAFVTSPMMLGMVFASTISGIVASRTSKFRPMIVGGSIGIAGGMFMLSRLTIDSSAYFAAAAMIVIGFGIGSSMPIVNLLVQNSVPHSMLGVVSSSNQFFRQIGGTLGTAIFGTIVVSELRSNLERELSTQLVQATPPDLLATLEEPRTLLNPDALDKLRDGYAALGPAGDGLYDAAILAMRVSLSDALSIVFFIAFLCTSVGFFVSLFIPESGALRRTWDDPEEAMAPGTGRPPAPPQRPEGEPAG
jgi:MFS family permease